MSTCYGCGTPSVDTDSTGLCADCATGCVATLMTALNERDAEIERLRHEVTLREQICADATLYARRLQEADDEVERLRELLREAHLALSFMPDPTRKLLDLRYRVREALGE